MDFNYDNKGFTICWEVNYPKVKAALRDFKSEIYEMVPGRN